MITNQVFQILNKQDWEIITYKLILHTCYLLGLSHESKEYDNLSKGLQAEDIVQDAITKVFTGERNWDPIEEPDLLKFLKWSVIKSMISNYRGSSSTQLDIPASSLSDSTDGDEPVNFFENVPGGMNSVEEEIFAKEILSVIRKNLFGDDDGLIIFEELIKGATPAQISTDLGISITDVRNAIKRIRNTKAKQFKPTLKSKSDA